VGYGALFLQPLGSTGDAVRSLLTGLATVACLGLLTLRLSLQGGELQRADAKLRLLAAATEQTGDLILITRADGRVELANEAFVRALGYPRQDLSRLTIRDLVAPDQADVIAESVAVVRDSGVWRGSLTRRRADGTTFPASCTVVGLRDGSGRITHFVGVERDTTDEIKRRNQLVHTERLSAMGELIAGVAHELNNPLQTIIGSAELLLEENQDDSQRRDLEVMRREAARAGQIVRNLLSFVRRAAPDRSVADLNDIVRATIQLRQYHLHQRDIGLELSEHGAALPVVANREEIQQVVLNLVLNAEHAIVSTGRAGTISVRTFTTGARHVVEVSDDGPGIEPALTGRIFEPFFTTKDVGQGTGLGLSISHGIARAHGGALDLQPTELGACFRLALPAAIAAERS
jgi:two-component system NtrC family sensor kinase